jgi:hypothetical protein
VGTRSPIREPLIHNINFAVCPCTANSGQTTGRDVSAFSPHDEQEVLFPPGTRFDVVSRHGDADILGIGMEASTGVDIVMRERVGG